MSLDIASLEKNLVGLRRYARALVGDQAVGDSLVAETLEHILKSSNATPGTRVDLFCCFETLLLRSDQSPQLTTANSPTDILKVLDKRAHRAFLLTCMEEFSIDETAQILGTTGAEVSSLLGQAEKDLTAELAATVLIIEDEPLIAGHIKLIAEALGHQVNAIAATHDEAVKLAAEHKPDLVLADVQLADASSGIEAVDEITSISPRPVIFITAFPERLLTGRRKEPAFLISKPFNPEALKAAISQALFVFPIEQKAA